MVGGGIRCYRGYDAMGFDGEVKWLPVSSASKQLGVSVPRVYQLIERGDLVSMKVDSTVLVSCRSIQTRVAARVGRPSSGYKGR